MNRECDQLSAELEERATSLSRGEQYWIGLAGPPGSGKSTLAEALRGRLGDLLTIIPMDGYHRYRRELDAMDDPVEAHARRGAPFSFDAGRFVDALVRARETGEGCFPGFDHREGDPVEGEIGLSADTRLVLVEGNYLLLDDDPWDRLREHVFDETWYLDVPLAECERRVMQRHVATGLTKVEARIRVETNDRLNAQLVMETSARNADRIL